MVTLGKITNGLEEVVTRTHRYPAPNGNGATIEVNGRLAVLSVIGSLAQEVMLKLQEATNRQYEMQSRGKRFKEPDPEVVIRRMFAVCFKELRPKIKDVIAKHPHEAPTSPGNNVLWHFHREWKNNKLDVMAKMQQEITEIAKAVKEHYRLEGGRS